MPITAVIFDITGVLFKENKLRLLKKIGLKRLLHYIARHRTNPLTMCLNTLQEIYKRDTTSNEGIVFKHRTMPGCIANWQRGLITNDELIEHLNCLIEELAQQDHFKSKHEQAIVTHILQTILNTEYLISISKPIAGTIKLVQELKNGGQVKLFIVSNMAHEPYGLLQEIYPDIVNLFDDVVISADVASIKPEAAIFEHLLTSHNLNPQECVFIDDQQENIDAANTLGIHGILFDKSTRVRKQLKKLNVVG